MKKILALVIVVMLFCATAMAAPKVEYEKDANDKTIVTVTLDGQDWTYDIEDPSVVEMGDEDINDDGTETWMLFFGKAAGVSGIALNNGVEEYTVSVACDAEGNLSVLSVNDLTEAESSIADMELTDDESVAVIALDGEGWIADVDSDAVVGMISESYDEENDQTVFEFLAGDTGVSDIAFTNGVDDEEITVAVNNDGEMNIVSLMDSEINDGYAVDFVTDGAQLTISAPSCAIVDCLNDQVAVLSDYNYSEEEDKTTAVFAAGENGTTEIVVTDGYAAVTITVTVAEGAFTNATTENTGIDAADVINPHNHDAVEVLDAFIDEDDEIVLIAKPGNVSEGDEIEFDEDEIMILIVDEDAKIMLPATEDAVENEACTDFMGWLDAHFAANENFTFRASLTLNDDGSVASIEYIPAK